MIYWLSLPFSLFFSIPQFTRLSFLKSPQKNLFFADKSNILIGNEIYSLFRIKMDLDSICQKSTLDRCILKHFWRNWQKVNWNSFIKWMSFSITKHRNWLMNCNLICYPSERCFENYLKICHKILKDALKNFTWENFPFLKYKSKN